MGGGAITSLKTRMFLKQHKFCLTMIYPVSIYNILTSPAWLNYSVFPFWLKFLSLAVIRCSAIYLNVNSTLEVSCPTTINEYIIWSQLVRKSLVIVAIFECNYRVLTSLFTWRAWTEFINMVTLEQFCGFQQKLLFFERGVNSYGLQHGRKLN